MQKIEFFLHFAIGLFSGICDEEEMGVRNEKNESIGRDGAMAPSLRGGIENFKLKRSVLYPSLIADFGEEEGFVGSSA